MDSAPLYEDIAEGPDGGTAYWLTTEDGVRIRAGVWNAGSKGTVLMLPGRTEYIEKYGRTAADLARRDYATVSIDWRGQGLAERLTDNRLVGHVEAFTDYQYDLNAVMELIAELHLPKPYFLIGHSMGAAIGLRAIAQGLPVNAAVFTGPMWGIAMQPLLRPIAWVMTSLFQRVGLGHLRMLTTSRKPYVLGTKFEGNLLTSDQESWRYMRRQEEEVPELQLAGPSISWVLESLREINRLQAMPAPSIPVLTFLGDNERIVYTPGVHDRMSRWPNGKLRIVPGEHEVLVETRAIRTQIMDESCALFDAHRR